MMDLVIGQQIVRAAEHFPAEHIIRFSDHRDRPNWHTSIAQANAEGWRTVVAQATMAHGLVVDLLLQTFYPGEEKPEIDVDLRFLTPVYAGDSVDVEATVVSIGRSLADASRVVMDVVCRNQRGSEVASGQATVIAR